MMRIRKEFWSSEFWRTRRLIAGSLLLAVVTAVPAMGLNGGHSPTLVEPPANIADARLPGGALLIAGGGYVTLDVRKRFVELAGGAQARIVVIPASDPPPGKENQWLDPWRSFGVQSVDFCNAVDRTMADDPAFCVPLQTATGVWFSGGYQELLARRYVDTAVQRCLHELLQRNGVIGGCSAGAAILSRVMIEEGEVTPVEARGLDLISDAIVDQHLLRRNRVWRLQQMLKAHPNLIGLGIDERTALVVEVRSWRLSVVGESYALVCVPESRSVPARIEVLKRGDDVLLSQLRAGHLAYHPPGEAAIGQD